MAESFSDPKFAPICQNPFILTADKKFENFLDVFTDMICRRCVGKEHSKGIFMSFIQAATPVQHMDRFFNDTEHGMFHGVMSCYMAFLVSQGRHFPDGERERLFASVLLHDFVRATSEEEKSHDKLLTNVYPKLIPETFIHSAPPEKDKDHDLIIADRLELRRYDDYEDWVDDRFHATMNVLPEETQNYIDYFYRKQRPCLKIIFESRQKLFIRHGLEIETFAKFDDNSNFPIHGSYEEHSNGFPIEICGPPPFRQCSTHAGWMNWGKIMGYATKEQLIECGCIPTICGTRDHAYFKGTDLVKLKHWVFTYRNLSIEDCKKIERVRSLPRIIHHRVLGKFFRLLGLLKSRLEFFQTNTAQHENITEQKKQQI